MLLEIKPHWTWLWPHKRLPSLGCMDTALQLCIKTLLKVWGGPLLPLNFSLCFPSSFGWQVLQVLAVSGFLKSPCSNTQSLPALFFSFKAGITWWSHDCFLLGGVSCASLVCSVSETAALCISSAFLVVGDGGQLASLLTSVGGRSFSHSIDDFFICDFSIFLCHFHQ